MALYRTRRLDVVCVVHAEALYLLMDFGCQVADLLFTLHPADLYRRDLPLTVQPRRINVRYMG